MLGNRTSSPHQLISAAKVVYGQQRINISFA
jgi:hypothetical protein